MYRNELPMRQFSTSTTRCTKRRATSSSESGKTGTNPAAIFSGAGHLLFLGASSYRATPAGGKTASRNRTAAPGTLTAAISRLSPIIREPSPWRPVSYKIAPVEISRLETLSRKMAEVKGACRCHNEVNLARKRCPSVSPRVQRRPTECISDAFACRVRRTRSVPATSTKLARHNDNDDVSPPTTEPTTNSRVRSLEKTQPVNIPREKTHQPVRRLPTRVRRTPSTMETTSRSRGGSPEKTHPVEKTSERKRCPCVSPQVQRRPTDRTDDAVACRVRRTRSVPATSTTLGRHHDNDDDFPRTLPSREPTIRSRGRSPKKTQPVKLPLEKTHHLLRGSSSRVPPTLPNTEPTSHSRGRSPEKTQPVKKSHQLVKRCPSRLPRPVPPAHSTKHIQVTEDSKPTSFTVTAKAALKSAWNKVSKIGGSTTRTISLLLLALLSVVVAVGSYCMYTYVNRTQVPSSFEEEPLSTSSEFTVSRRG